MAKKLRQCVCCGYYARQGEREDGKFTCAVCVKERFEEEERRYEDAEWLEVSRVGYQYYRVVS